MSNRNQYPNPTAELIEAIKEGTQRISSAVKQEKPKPLPLNGTVLVCEGAIVDVLGIPIYVDDISQYSAWGITKTGWYAFARIASIDGTTVTAQTAVTGADGCISVIGSKHVDIAVRFGVTAESKKITVNWGPYADTFVFTATDLAVRNLDYRATFYVYDLASYAQWAYAFTADTTFAEGKNYYVKNGSVYEKSTVQTKAYELTADETFQNGKIYYTENNGEYTAAEVTQGESVPAETYYEQTTVPVPAYYVDQYTLTADETFQNGKTYYAENDGEYTAAEVTQGEAVTADTYYEHSYAQAEGTFQEGVTYYTKTGTVYSTATVTVGAIIPAYYNHSKVTFSGMARNITYQLDEIIDCPQEYVLPEIEDDGHGCWFEFRLRHSGSFSSTLILEDPEAKIATEHTQSETAGMNMVDLHYMSLGGVKLWRFMNTHSSIPA